LKYFCKDSGFKRIENRIYHKDQFQLFESAEFKLYLQINCVRDRSGILLCSESGTKDRANSPTLVVTPNKIDTNKA